MAFSSIARYFGFAILLVGAAMLIPLAAALSAHDEMAGNYGFAAAITLFSGAGVLILSGKTSGELDVRSTLMLILFWWTATPVFGALPLWLEGWTLIDGYFEIVSALTTTGATLADASIHDRPIDLLWRAILQWVGGLASLSIAAAIFVRPAFTGADTIAPSYSRGERKSYLHAIGSAVRAFLGAYVLLTLIAFTFLTANGVESISASIMAFSTMASGGIIPRADGLGAFGPTIAFVLAPFIFLSAMNFILIEKVLRGRGRTRPDGEFIAYLVLIVAVGVILWLLAGERQVGAALFNALSLIATNGVTIGERPDLVFALITVIIGGSAVSTAGGLKILRWLIILKRSRLEVRRLINPSAVFGAPPAANELGVWMHFLIFTIVVGLLTTALTAGGHSFELSAAGAVGALANAGPVITFAAEGEQGYRLFDDAAVRLILAAGMILGRLEGVAALMLINRAFWRS